MISDPLRAARSAVNAGDFRGALVELYGLSETQHRNPEWKLLASMAQWRLGEYAKSRATAEDARDRYRSWGDADGEMRALNVGAAGAFAMGQLDGAERGFLKATTLAKRLNDELMAARCANNLGNVYYYRGQSAEALSYYARAASRFARLGFSRGIIESLHNLATVLRSLGELGDSRMSASRAIELAQQEGERRLEAQATAGQAETLIQLGELRVAEALLQRSLDMARTLGDRLTELDALRIGSLLAARRNHIETARTMGEAAHAIALEVVHPWMIAVTARHLARVERSDGEGKVAGEYLRTAADNFERVGALATVEEIRRMLEEG
ncbi:MAG: tetratricopeptide repeat protein [Gemmatimonadales bacterium]